MGVVLKLRTILGSIRGDIDLCFAPDDLIFDEKRTQSLSQTSLIIDPIE